VTGLFPWSCRRFCDFSSSYLSGGTKLTAAFQFNTSGIPVKCDCSGASVATATLDSILTSTNCWSCTAGVPLLQTDKIAPVSVLLNYYMDHGHATKGVLKLAVKKTCSRQ